jgi:Rrf2 family iron-sulfur cluster assembly transcriptional regulator
LLVQHHQLIIEKDIVMRLTTKGRFAVTAMIDLALRQHSGPITLSAISQRQSISLSYLEQLFGKLRRHELVDSVRGPGGGYTLARLARNITVADIIFAVDEPLDATNCAGKTDCASGTDGRPGICMTHELWASLNRTMVDFLDSVSLQDLVDQQRMRQLQDANNNGLEKGQSRVNVVSSNVGGQPSGIKSSVHALL